MDSCVTMKQEWAGSSESLHCSTKELTTRRAKWVVRGT